MIWQHYMYSEKLLVFIEEMNLVLWTGFKNECCFVFPFDMFQHTIFAFYIYAVRKSEWVQFDAFIPGQSEELTFTFYLLNKSGI